MRSRTGRIIQLEEKEELRTTFPVLFKAFDQGLRSVIVVPLISRDRVIGAMHIRSSTVNAYTFKDLELAERIGFQIAGAIANAQLFEERKKNEAALRKSEEQYRLLTENMSDVIWIRDLNLKCVYISPSVEKLIGFTVEEARRLTLEEAFTPDSVARARKVLQEELALGKDENGYSLRSRTLEMESYHKDGSTIWTESVMTFLRDSTGEICGIQGSSRDLTERKRAEAQKRKQERLNQTLLDSLPCVALLMRSKTREILAMNQAAKDAGCTIGQTCFETWPKFEKPCPWCLAPALWTEGQEQHCEAEALGAIWDAHWVPLSDDLYLHYAFDITEGKRNEAALKYTNSLLNATLDSTANGLLVVTTEGRVDSFNRKFLELWRIPEDLAAQGDDQALLGFVLDQLKAPEVFLVKVKELYRSPEACSFDELEFRDGRVFERYSQPQQLEGVVVGRVWSFRDITHRKRMEEALRKSENEYRNVVDNLKSVVFQTDAEGHWTFLNPAWEEVTGFPVTDCLGRNFLDYVHPEDRERNLELFRPLIERQKDYCRHEIRYLHRDGGFRWIEVYARLTRDDIDQVLGTTGTLTDITSNKQAEEALRESEARYRLLAENASDVIWTVDLENQLTYISPSVTRLLGYTVEEAKSRTMQEAFTPESFEAMQRKFWQVMAREIAEQADLNQSQILEIELNHKDGTVVQAEGHFSLIRDARGKPAGIIAIVRNITDRKQAEEALRASLLEKEVLLQEIHHRVKNNLQVAGSLLNLQSNRMKDPEVKAALEESRLRIQAMAMIHETLYRGPNLAAIDLSSYLQRLVQYLQGAFRGNVRVKMEVVSEEIRLNLDQAMHCGLIVNELVTNALKHAFPSGREGTIRIEAHLIGDREVEVKVSDNGVGFPAGMDVIRLPSLGLQLVRGLAERQLRGRWEIQMQGGTVFTVRWPQVAEKDVSIKVEL